MLEGKGEGDGGGDGEGMDQHSRCYVGTRA